MKIPTLIISALTVIGAHAGTENRTAAVEPATCLSTIDAKISGVEDAGRYVDLPPILVEFAGLPRRTAVWVEIYQGTARESARGHQVESKLFAQKGDCALLNVGDLSRIYEEGGTWTIQVLANSGLATKVVAHTTFALQSGGQQNELAPSFVMNPR